MDIELKQQDPDGVNITIKNLIVDTYEEAFEIIHALERAKQVYSKQLEEDIKKIRKKHGLE